MAKHLWKIKRRFGVPIISAYCGYDHNPEKLRFLRAVQVANVKRLQPLCQTILSALQAPIENSWLRFQDPHECFRSLEVHMRWNNTSAWVGCNGSIFTVGTGAFAVNLKLETWPQRPRYFAAANTMQHGR